MTSALPPGQPGLLRAATFLAIPYLVFTLLFLLIDVTLSQFGWFGLLPPHIVISNPMFNHGYKANRCVDVTELGSTYHFCTNSVGFRDQGNREVAISADKPRLVIIGDSFTEGVGLAFDQTFTGMLIKAHRGLDILNAGVKSYAPSAYYGKIKWLIDGGYQVDQVLVMIDISDIQDEAAIYYNEPVTGELLTRKSGVASAVFQGAHSRLPPRLREFLEDNLSMTYYLYKSFEKLFVSEPVAEKGMNADDVFSWPRSAWSYQPADRLAAYYAPLGVQGGIDKAVAQMTALSDYLKEKGIPLSVGAYPWPAQLKNDKVDGLAATLWQNWCRGRCAHFVNAFPLFFAYKDAHPDTWYGDLFIAHEVHFNEAGNRLLKQAIEQELAPVFQGRD